MDKAQHTSDPVPTKQHLAEEIAHKDAKKKDVEEENEEKLADLERMLAFQHLMPTVDPWGQSIEDTLDVMIPRPITHKLAGEKPLDKLKTVYATVSGNSKNWVKNTAALSALMSLDSIPGKSFYGLSWIAQIRASFGFLGTQSVKPDALLAPLRQMALESYEDLNKALANRNDKEITRLTTFTYQQQGYMSPTEPRFGNRMMIHALLNSRLNSLEMYTDRGVALHAPATEPHWVADTERVESWRVPAQRKRVTEYLVMEKRMWVQGPWQFREQLW
ncbi:hypothetical protein BDZ97DRAFT_1813404 [Flammula alnicola]|nr:hypothetical protein BDZ97DRAFT_1813404 [Flammula alnicola]